MQVSLHFLFKEYLPVFTELRKFNVLNLLFISSPVQYMKPIASTTMLMENVTRAATQKSVVGMAWTVQRKLQKDLLRTSWFWLF